MMGFPIRTLGDLCDEAAGVIRTGPFGSQLHESDYTTEGIPVIMPKDLIGGCIADDSIARVDEKTAERLAVHRVLVGDIVYGRRGDIGRRALISWREAGWLCGTGCLRISIHKPWINSAYLYYYLGAPAIVDSIAKRAVGATMLNLNTSILRDVGVVVPPRSLQDRITDILSSYDDLIGNNTKRIRLLQQQTAFVFASTEGESARHSDVRKLGEIADSVGGTIRTGPFGSQLHESDYTPEGVPVVMPKNLIDGRIDTADIARIPDGLVQKLTQHKLSEGDIVYGRRGDIGRRAFIRKRQAGWLCGTGCLRISLPGGPLHSRYLHQYLGKPEIVALIAARAVGATMPNLNTSILREMAVRVPSPKLQEKFTRSADVNDELIDVLVEQNRILGQQRDLLLPRLISGEIDVSRLEASARDRLRGGVAT